MLHRVLRPRRIHKPAGFTLAELLIVIAIIGVLMSILIPTLASARRSANAVKCLSNLKSIGSAFQMYAQDNNRAFPIAYYAPGSNIIPGTAQYKPWQDFLVKYVHKKDPSVAANGAADIAQFQNISGGSVFWGCPQFTSELYFKADTLPGTQPENMFNTGYGMSVFALAPYLPGNESTRPGFPAFFTPILPDGTSLAKGGPTALINSAGGSPPALPTRWGSFFKMEQWSRRGAEKALLADSNTFVIAYASGRAARSKLTFQPFATGLATDHVDVDASRHIAPISNNRGTGQRSSSENKAFSQKGINTLFVDGHAGALNPIEAWAALRGAGIDWSTNP
jgi:prepilin-type N-terminal cleavage/methylation domain-containing protein/prepilin-type processing-associated H-X9-DG protein